MSYWLTAFLAGTSLTPNAITLTALVAGLLSAVCFGLGIWAWSVVGAFLLTLCYVLDNCDGEIARLKDLKSELGKTLDTFVDWIVHAAFFAALGIGVSNATGEAAWAWLGWISVAGASLNFWLGQRRASRASLTGGGIPDTPEDSHVPETWSEKLLYAFRELSRADFCFIVLALSLLDLAWLLLPAGAIGAQVYWVTGLVKGADRYHV